MSCTPRRSLDNSLNSEWFLHYAPARGLHLHPFGIEFPAFMKPFIRVSSGEFRTGTRIGVLYIKIFLSYRYIFDGHFISHDSNQMR